MVGEKGTVMQFCRPHLRRITEMRHASADKAKDSTSWNKIIPEYMSLKYIVSGPSSKLFRVELEPYTEIGPTQNKI